MFIMNNILKIEKQLDNLLRKW